MVTTAAPLTPTMAPMRAQIHTVPMASPPRTPPHQRCIMWYRRVATPERSRIIAMKTNSGMATSVKLFMLSHIFEATR